MIRLDAPEGDPDGAARTVEDDPGANAGAYTGDPGASLFTSAQSWGPCCTDGQALSRMPLGLR